MENENLKIVEINGVKLEVDMRYAKVVDNYRVGDNVKVLVKGYGEHYDQHPGVIVGFADYKDIPSIEICYLKIGYNSVEVCFLTYNKMTKDVEIVKVDFMEELRFKKADVVSKIDSEISKKHEEIKDLEFKKEYFLKNFNQYFRKEINAELNK